MIETSESWASPQRILVILAHPDDPEFFCGASIARWVKQGHQVSYCLLTQGDKGGSDRSVSPQLLAETRILEQGAAAARLGVKSVEFLDYPDGYLVPSLETRKAVTRVIRKHRPDILVSCDPENIFPSGTYRINHPDHRAAGQIVVDAVFPAAGNPFFFPELIDEEGLLPHTVHEVWLSLTSHANVALDVTETWEEKIKALHEHCSQIGPDLKKFDERIRSRRLPDSTPENPKYEERFLKLTFA